MKETYNTKQKKSILEIIKEQKKEFTIKEIHNQVKDSCGLTTVYRLIDKLVEEGIVKKIVTKNIVHYQYLEKCDDENHFYLKCNNCGTLIHVDCQCIDEIKKHIIKEHKFKIINDNLIFNGLCEKCLKEESKC